MTKTNSLQLQKVKDILDQIVTQGRKAVTISELFEQVYEHHWLKNVSEEWARETKRIYESTIRPVFGHKDAAFITVKEVRSWHSNINSPTNANRALAVLSKIFTHAISEELVHLMPNPCFFVKHRPERSRSVFADRDKIIKIVEILRREYPKKKEQVTFLLILMYTAARPSVFLNAKRSELVEQERDGQRIALLKSRGKNTRKTADLEVTVIPPQALELLDRLSKERLDGKIFGCKIPRKFWQKVIREAGCPELWVRDWRRTFSTVALSGGESIDVIGEVLNHRTTQTTKVYAKLTDDRRIKAVSDNAERFDKIINSSLGLENV